MYNSFINTINNKLPKVKVDMIGQKLEVGDTVLCKGFCSPMIDTKAEIISINRKTVSVNLHVVTWSMGKFNPPPANHSGPWNYYPDSKRIDEYQRRTKQPSELLKVPKELLESADSQLQQIVDDHPELFI